jgi:hypothetical protein
MFFIFPLIYIVSFFVALREVLKGNTQAILLFLIFGLSIYTTAMSVAFIIGLNEYVHLLQSFKEILITSALILNIIYLKYRPRLHIIDYVILAFLLYTFLYVILPIGELSFMERLMAFKSVSFFGVIYFTGRFTDIRSVFISKYFNYIVLLTILAGAVVFLEVITYTHLQTLTGFADYNFYVFNLEPGGMFGLTTTFESDGGYKRFASFFSTPIEHGAAAMLALCVIAALYTTDNNKIKINGIGLIALAASAFSILFAISRAPLIGYLIVIYVYSLITKRKIVTNTIHAAIILMVLYIIYLLTRFENVTEGVTGLIINTIDFSDPSSVGHVLQWVEGILAMVEKPLGLGLGSSGRIANTMNENVGGENQFIVIGVQAGVIALLLYLWAHINLIKTSLKWLPVLKGKERKVCMTVLLLKIGLTFLLFTTEIEASAYISYINWFLSGLLLNIIMKPTTDQPVLAYDN